MNKIKESSKVLKSINTRRGLLNTQSLVKYSTFDLKEIISYLSDNNYIVGLTKDKTDGINDYYRITDSGREINMLGGLYQICKEEEQETNRSKELHQSTLAVNRSTIRHNKFSMMQMTYSFFSGLSISIILNWDNIIQFFKG